MENGAWVDQKTKSKSKNLTSHVSVETVKAQHNYPIREKKNKASLYCTLIRHPSARS